MATKEKRMVLAVFDYSNGQVNIYDVPTEYQKLEQHDILDKFEVDESTSEWMFVEKELLVHVHTKSLRGEFIL